MVVTAPGRCEGALVKLVSAKEQGAVEVEFTHDSGPYKAGERARFVTGGVRWLLNPGDLVTYDPAYLRRNGADVREYRRRAQVVKRLEGALVKLEWQDGQGPQTDSTLHLVRL